MTKERIAVVCMNLGGPLNEADIKPFLFNFFMDKNIIAAPLPLRFLIAKWISKTRGEGAALRAYRELGGKSPLLENTQKQAQALQEKLQKTLQNVKVFVSMRYWHPMSTETVKDVQKFNPDKIILLPLYPQFSTTTTKSSFENWQKQGLSIPTEKIGCYPLNIGFIKASTDLIRRALIKSPTNTRLLFSAHGLPEKIIKAGDPYQWQCEQSAEAIVKELNIKSLDWQICYQSRVGRLKWITPSTEDALKKAAADGKNIIIYPHAFVSEHVETLVEIDKEYRHLAKSLGIAYFDRVETVMTHPDFIAGLEALVLDKIAGKKCGRICPGSFKGCICHG